MARVTVISSVYNRQRYIDKTMQSLRDQDYTDFNAVIVDDGSTDGSFERLKAYESDAITVRSQENQGFVRTIIDLCAAADTEFIALMGAGDESLPGRLSAQVAFLDSHPSVVAVGCGIENVDETTGERWQVKPAQPIRHGPIEGGFGISHGEVMFRREAYLKSGGYRAFFDVGQASDLFRRMSRLGDFGYVEDVLYRRHLLVGGVNANARMLAKREILAAISIAVHKKAIIDGAAGDDLDRYGLLFPYMAEPDRRVAVGLARAGVKTLLVGDRRLALRLSRRSICERLTPQGAIACLAIFAAVGPLRKPVLNVLARLFKGVNEHSLKYFQGRPQV